MVILTGCIVYSIAINTRHTTRRSRRLAHPAPQGKLFAVPSWPCFEVWILLHYEYTTRAFQASGNKSPCANVIARIHRRHNENYKKASNTVFEDLAVLLPEAMRNADRLAKHNSSTQSVNPATAMHDLMAYLETLRRS